MLSGKKYDKVYIRDIFQFLAPFSERGQRPQGGAKRMNKYELAVVVSAKLEDDARTATVEKVKEYITRFGGTITNVDEWGKKKLAYDIQSSTLTKAAVFGKDANWGRILCAMGYSGKKYQIEVHP